VNFLITKANLKHAGSDSAHPISREILEYLLQNPRAQDTMDGILQWWLLEHYIKHNVALVRDAISFLIRKNLVLVRQGRDMQTYFRINQDRYQEIFAFIQSDEGTSSD
jgi:hypothetical protein